MKLPVYIVFVLSAILFFACDSKSDKPGEVAFADISDAHFLGIEPDQGAESPINNLVKITTSNLGETLERVDFLDKDGEVMGEAFLSVIVRDIVILSQDYTVLLGLFTFHLAGGEKQTSTLLLNNFTGALYDLEGQYRGSPSNAYLGSKYHQQDASGNIYFHTEGIKRLVIEDPDEIHVDHFLDYPTSYRGYFVDARGNVYFKNGELLKFAGAGIIETGVSLLCFGGFDGDVYGFQTDASKSLDLYKLKTEGKTLEKEVALHANIFFENWENPTLYYPDKMNKQHLFLSGHLFHKRESDFEYIPFGIVFDEGKNFIYPIELPTGLSEEMQIFGIEDHHIWIRDHMDQEKFYAIDLQNISTDDLSGKALLGDYSEFHLPENLDIMDIRFSENRLIEFSAYDRETEVRVRGFLSMANGIEYSSEESPLGSMWLTRIN